MPPKAAKSPFLWPPPREMKLGRSTRLTQPMSLRIVGDAPWRDTEVERAASQWSGVLGRPVAQRDGGALPLIVAGTALLCAQEKLEPPPGSEGYVLSISSERVWLGADTAAGTFYGLQTLGQLLLAAGGTSLPTGTIRDWPACPIRGAHVYLPAREHLGFFFQFLDFLARYRYNALILEIGGGLEYERRPEISEAWRRFCKEARAYDPAKCRHRESMSTERMKHELGFEDVHESHPTGPCALQTSRYFYKDSTHTELAGGDCLTKQELRLIVDECAKRHIEVIPEVQALSHSYYLCVAHPEIAERQDDPWPDTYCPSNPKSYEILFDVMEEVIEVVRPRMMHIGHDEVYTLGVCPKCRKRTGHDLFADDVIRIHDFLSQHGVRTAMWGDKLMRMKPKKGERFGGIGGDAAKRVCPDTGRCWSMPATYKAAARIPKDVLMLDWQWGRDRRSEQNFTRHDFDVLYGNFEPLAFPGWARRSVMPEVQGAELSTWDGVTPETFGHDCIFHQFFPGSAMLWTGKPVAATDVAEWMAKDLIPTIDRLTGQNRWLVNGDGGKPAPIDLSPAARALPLTVNGSAPIRRRLTTMLDTGAFELRVRGGRLAEGIVLEHKSTPAETVHVGRPLKRLLVLHATSMERTFWRPSYYSYHRSPAVLARYTVRYADGRTATFDARYGEEIGPVKGAWPSVKASYCYRAVPVAMGSDHAFYAQEWSNPRPDTPVDSVEVALGPDAADEGAVIVAAMSVVE